MNIPPHPPDEAAGRDAFDASAILASEPEDPFERIVDLVGDLLDAPIAGVTVVDETGTRFQAKRGIALPRLPRDTTFCNHTLAHDDLFVVEDATTDARFRDSALVRGHGVRFYAGVPVRTRAGVAVGALCVLDRRTRRLGDRERAIFRRLAALAAEELGLRMAKNRVAREMAEQRATAAELRRHRQRLQTFLDAASDWLWETDAELELTFVSDALAPGVPVAHVVGRRPWELPGAAADPELWAAHRATLARWEPFRNFRCAVRVGEDDADVRHLEVSGDPVFDDEGRFAGYQGCGRDVTAAVRAEATMRTLSRRLEALEEANIIGVVAGERGTITAANDEFLRMVGRTRGELDAGRLDWRGLTAPGFERVDDRLTAELLRAGRAAPVEKEAVRPDGTRVPVLVTVVLVDRETFAWQALVHDMTERKAAEARICELAFTDPLTGLANRRRFNDRLSAIVDGAGRPARGALAVVDLDHFKDVNDALGHDAGDALLKDVARRLQAAVREGDLVARFGGDEFALILQGDLGRDQIARVAERIIHDLQTPMTFAGREVHPGASLGIACFPEDGRDAEALLKNADVALYRAKATGRRAVCFFEPAMRADTLAKLELASDIRRGLARGEFVAVFQPVVGLDDGRTRGLEVLMRWRHPERGLLTPACFLPAAAAAGLVPALGRTVFELVVAQMGRWRERYGDVGVVAVNVTAAQIREEGFADGVLDALARHDLAPDRLELEITEDVLIAEDCRLAETIHGLRDAGVSVALDDFGTGFASLAHLKRLPVDVLKIDRSIVAEVDTDADSATIARAVVGLAHGLRMRVVAEGVETRAQRDALRLLGCDYGQGYFWAWPGAADGVASWLAGAASPVVAASSGTPSTEGAPADDHLDHQRPGRRQAAG